MTQAMYFVQTPKVVVMILSSKQEVRHVYLTDKHSDNVKPSWYGESIGHYGGDTLVVDTIGIDERMWVDGFGTPHTKQLHVIERFHLIEDGNVLEANVRVEDPGAFTTPWDAIQRFRQYEAGSAQGSDRAPCAVGERTGRPTDGDDLRRESELLLSGRDRPAYTAGGGARFLTPLEDRSDAQSDLSGNQPIAVRISWERTNTEDYRRRSEGP